MYNEIKYFIRKQNAQKSIYIYYTDISMKYHREIGSIQDIVRQIMEAAMTWVFGLISTFQITEAIWADGLLRISV